MSTYAFVASHHTVDLTTVAALSAGASGVPDVLAGEMTRQLGVKGAVVLATCNRLEMYVQLHVSAHVPMVRELIVDSIAHTSGLDKELVNSSFDVYADDEATRHLLTVASGLESAVVGEREITGQVRRALAVAQAKAQEDGVTLPGELVQLFEHAAHTARQVGQHTALGAQGRSIVSVALDLADEVAEKDWSTRRALIFGTGAYAGATLRLCATVVALIFGSIPVRAVPPSSQQNARFLRCRWTAWSRPWLLPTSLLVAPAALIRCFPNRFRAVTTRSSTWHFRVTLIPRLLTCRTLS